MLQFKSIRKYMIMAGLLLVVLKMTYNAYAFVYDTRNQDLENFFHYGLIFILIYYCISFTKKPKRKYS